MKLLGRYDKYKKINSLFINELPSNWEYVKLKHIANIYNGNSLNDDYKLQFESENEEELSYIASKDINVDNSEINYQNGTRIPRDFESFKIAPRFSSLLCIEGGSAGRKIGFTNQDVYFVNKLACFRAEDNKTSKFIFYNLQSNLFQSQFFNSLTGLIGGVSITNIRNFNIPLPPFQEMCSIINYLDNQTSIIDEIISRKEKQIELLKEKRQAIINETVTQGLNLDVKMKDSGIGWLGKIPYHWSLKKMKYVFEIKKEIAGTLGYDVLSVTQRGIKIRDIENFKGQLSMDYSKYQIVEEGEYIMNHMDLLTGWVDISKWKGVTSPDYRVFRLKNKLCRKNYYLYIFQLCYTNKIFFGLGQGVSTLGRWRMPAEQFNNFILPIPPHNEQIEIENFIEEKTNLINELIDKQTIIIEKLKEYRQSIISEAVTGKIDVRDWQPNNSSN